MLRLYAWDPPALSLGHFQPAAAFAALVRETGLAVVRRPTGGGAIHHADELTFCLVATPGRCGYPTDVIAAYRAVHASLIRALATLGVEVGFRGGDAPLSVDPRSATLCFEDHTELDLVDAEGRKLVGSAQRRRGERVLHHGSIPLDPPALSPGAAGLRDLAGRQVAREELEEAVLEAFATGFCEGGLSESRPHEEEQQAARARAPELRVRTAT